MAELLGRLDRLGLGRLGHQDDKLLAAVTGQEVGLAQNRAQPGDNLLEAAVADQVAVGVVDLFEVVDVDHGQGKNPAVALEPLHLRLDPLVVGRSVGRPGERIDGQPAGQLLVDLLDPADLLGHPGQFLPHPGHGLAGLVQAEFIVLPFMLDRLFKSVELAGHQRLQFIEVVTLLDRTGYPVDLPSHGYAEIGVGLAELIGPGDRIDQLVFQIGQPLGHLSQEGGGLVAVLENLLGVALDQGDQIGLEGKQVVQVLALGDPGPQVDQFAKIRRVEIKS